MQQFGSFEKFLSFTLFAAEVQALQALNLQWCGWRNIQKSWENVFFIFSWKFINHDGIACDYWILSAENEWKIDESSKLSFEFQLTVHPRSKLSSQCSEWRSCRLHRHAGQQKYSTNSCIITISMTHKRVNSTKWRKEARKVSRFSFKSQLSIDIFSYLSSLSFVMIYEKSEWNMTESDHGPSEGEAREVFLQRNSSSWYNERRLTNSKGEEEEKLTKNFFLCLEKKRFERHTNSLRKNEISLYQLRRKKISHENKWNFQHSAESN